MQWFKRVFSLNKWSGIAASSMGSGAKQLDQRLWSCCLGPAQIQYVKLPEKLCRVAFGRAVV